MTDFVFISVTYTYGIVLKPMIQVEQRILGLIGLGWIAHLADNPSPKRGFTQRKTPARREPAGAVIADNLLYG